MSRPSPVPPAAAPSTPASSPPTLRLVVGDDPQADVRGDRRRAAPFLHTTVAPRARRAPGARLLAWGAAIAVVSSGLAVVLGVLVGRIDGTRADLSLGGHLGDERSQALVTAAQVAALGVVAGLVLVVAGILVRLAPRLLAPRPR